MNLWESFFQANVAVEQRNDVPTACVVYFGQLVGFCRYDLCTVLCNTCEVLGCERVKLMSSSAFFLIGCVSHSRYSLVGYGT